MSKTKSIEELFSPEEISDKDDISRVWDVLGRYGLQNLAYGEELGRNPGYIFRGQADYCQPLISSLELKLRKQSGDDGSIDEEKLKSEENKLVSNFVQGDGRRVAEIIDRLSKNKNSEPESSVFWWLSVMQHYSHDLSLPTRFLDFTLDIRFALFFAIEQLEKEKAHCPRSKELLSNDLIIYCFPCKNLERENDPNNNKCPFKVSPDFLKINMHVAIGCQMDLLWMEPEKAFFREHLKNRNGQHWGWDRPYFQNPRLEFQKGIFVYPYDYPKTPLRKDGESWLIQNLMAGPRDDRFNMGTSAFHLPAKRIRIPARHANDLKNILENRYRLTSATVYVDYARVETDQPSSNVKSCQPDEIQ